MLSVRCQSPTCRVRLPRTPSGNAASPVPLAIDPSRPDRFERLLHGESFWTAVHEPFMSRDMTREELRHIIRRGLTRTHGSYRQLTALFNLPPTDYKSLLNFLRKHDCHVPYKPFRTIGTGSRQSGATPGAPGEVHDQSIARTA